MQEDRLGSRFAGTPGRCQEIVAEKRDDFAPFGPARGCRRLHGEGASGTTDSGAVAQGTHMSTTYQDAVWEKVAELGGPMDATGRAANAEVLEGLEAAGLTPPQAAIVMVELVTRTHQTLQLCFPLFEDLQKTLKFMGHLIDEGHLVADAMTRMLETKLQMAKVYNFVALVGPGADVDDLPSPEETQAEVEESEQELEAWYERLRQAANEREGEG